MNQIKKILQKNIHNLIKEKFNLEIPVFIISYLELEDLLNNAPSWWGTGNKEIYDNIILYYHQLKLMKLKMYLEI